MRPPPREIGSDAAGEMRSPDGRSSLNRTYGWREKSAEDPPGHLLTSRACESRALPGASRMYLRCISARAQLPAADASRPGLRPRTCRRDSPRYSPTIRRGEPPRLGYKLRLYFSAYTCVNPSISTTAPKSPSPRMHRLVPTLSPHADLGAISADPARDSVRDSARHAPPPPPLPPPLPPPPPRRRRLPSRAPPPRISGVSRR